MKNKLQTDAARLGLWVFLPLALCVLIHSLVLTPLYLSLASNVAWNETALPRLIGYFQLFLEYAFYWLLFSFLGCAIDRKKLVFAFLLIFAILVVRQGIELVMGYTVMGFPSVAAFFGEEFLYLLLQLFFDCVLLLLSALVIHFWKRPKGKATLLACLPFAVQIVSLCIMLANTKPLTSVLWLEAALDLIVHIVCLFAGFGVIFFLGRQLRKETEYEKTL